MLSALIKKDLRLLRLYIRVAILSTVLCYVVTAVIIYWLTSYMETWQSFASRAMMTLGGGSNAGMVFTIFLAALLSGSAFTLERSDRSAEFLACLPPSRLQNLCSKLTVVIGAVSIQLLIHLLAVFLALKFEPYARLVNMHIDLKTYWVLSATLFSVVGFSLAASSCLKSNGVPILIGLMAWSVNMAVTGGLGWLLNITLEGSVFEYRYATTSIVLGITMALCGAYWYLMRSEP